MQLDHIGNIAVYANFKNHKLQHNEYDILPPQKIIGAYQLPRYLYM